MWKQISIEMFPRDKIEKSGQICPNLGSCTVSLGVDKSKFLISDGSTKKWTRPYFATQQLHVWPFPQLRQSPPSWPDCVNVGASSCSYICCVVCCVGIGHRVSSPKPLKVFRQEHYRWQEQANYPWGTITLCLTSVYYRVTENGEFYVAPRSETIAGVDQVKQIRSLTWGISWGWQALEMHLSVVINYHTLLTKDTFTQNLRF